VTTRELRARKVAPDRRGDDGELQPDRARPDRQQRSDDPAHVGRHVQRPGRDPHDQRRRPEEDYEQVATLDGCVAYVETHTTELEGA
jgi:hypothetical protein